MSGLIIRLIDLVFILLFGFIAISQIGALPEVQPPKSTEAASYEAGAKRVIVVGVRKDGTYPIDDGIVVLPDSARLQRFLAEQAALSARSGEALGVRIRASFDTPVHYSLIVARICGALDLPKGLDVVRVAKQGL